MYTYVVARSLVMDIFVDWGLEEVIVSKTSSDSFPSFVQAISLGNV